MISHTSQHSSSLTSDPRKAWGVFLAHFLSHSTFPHATQLEYALIGGMSISQACFVSPVVGITNDKLGTRTSLLVGTMFVSLSMLTSSFASEVWHLFLSQGVCFGWGLGFLYITAAPVVGQWFSRRRSLALGIASSGAGFGGIVYVRFRHVIPFQDNCLLHHRDRRHGAGYTLT